MPVGSDLLKAARKWKAQDPDAQTKAVLAELIDRSENGDDSAAAELAACFADLLEFGTAGLRGALGPGPARMNEVVVSYAAEGVGAALRQAATFGQVLIGHDARHKSADFARLSAEVLAGMGHRPILIEGAVPTPLVAFGVRHLDCVAGIVVTASHNPPGDNGYKVYWGDGRLIVPPTDEIIGAAMARSSKRPLFRLQRSTDYRHLDQNELAEAYVERIARSVGGAGPRELRWVYTPLHGVGAAMVERVADRLGFGAPLLVAEQAEPDPTFPTVTFPNPEEPGALDLALALARTEFADLVVANDPDADRCAVAIPAADGSDVWRVLHGDELGALLGDFLARRGVRGTFANSIVSGSMLGRIAAAHGLAQATTLTGFKWIARVDNLAYGYEEAIGYCCDPQAVADKDGLSALALVLTLTAEEKAAGRTLSDRLDLLATEHGVHLSDQLSVRFDDPAIISASMARLRAEPPSELCGEPVQVVDLLSGAGGLPPTDAIRMLGETVTVTVRPSGTEAKLKCYLEARVAVEVTRRDLAGSRAEASGMIERLRGEVQAALGL